MVKMPNPGNPVTMACEVQPVRWLRRLGYSRGQVTKLPVVAADLLELLALAGAEAEQASARRGQQCAWAPPEVPAEWEVAAEIRVAAALAAARRLRC